jgi:hypothetical protein
MMMMMMTTTTMMTTTIMTTTTTTSMPLTRMITTATMIMLFNLFYSLFLFLLQSLIGVHVRMEDHEANRAVLSGKRVATPAYFVKAMTHFRQKLGRDVTFVVILSKSSREWWKSNVTSARDVTFLERSHPAVDLEILSRLDFYLELFFIWNFSFECVCACVCVRVCV